MSYGSQHDFERLKFDLCIDCLDKVLDIVIPMCKINPLIDEDWSAEHDFLHP